MKSKTKKSYKHNLVTTTFKLSEETIADLKYLAEENRTPIKDVFEILCDILKKSSDIPSHEINKLNNITRPVKKSYVLKRQSLQVLNFYKKKCKVSRDLLVEYLMESYSKQQLIEKELFKKNYKKALEIINNFAFDAENVESELNGFLSEDDPIPDVLEIIIALIKYLRNRIEERLNDGPPVEIPASIGIAYNDLK